MIVTKVEAVTKTKFRIYIDEKPAFSLYKGEVSRYQIRQERELSEEVYEKICAEVLLKRAKRRALFLLNEMGRTEAQLRKKLKQGDYPENIVEEAVEYVKSFGYIDDAAYARSFIESRKEKKSRREIYAKLCEKGVSSELIESAFEDCYESEDSKSAITEILRRKKYNPESAGRQETQKILGYLTRKGFRYEDIRQVIQVSEWNA